MIPTLPQNLHSVEECFDVSKKFQRPTNSNKYTVNQEKQVFGFQHYIQVVSKFAHNYLYCRDPSEMLTVSENKILTNQRHKYINYINKNFKYKLPQEFTSKKVMKEKRIELFKKLKEERLKKQEQQHLKAPKRRRQIKQKQLDKAPKKKAKLNEEQVLKKSKAAKKQGKNKKDTDKNSKEALKEIENQIVSENEQDAANAVQSQQDLDNKDLDNFEEQDE